MDEWWPQQYDNSVEFLKRCIKYNVSTGLYRKDTNELVGWVAVLETGATGTLCIKEEYREQGLAENLLIYNADRIYDAGGLVFGYIVHENTRSLHVLEKIGLTKHIENCSWIGVERDKPKTSFPLWGM